MDPTGIFAAIHLSAPAYERFCHHHGEALVRDINYILANRAIERRHEDETVEAGKRFKTVAEFSAFSKGRPPLQSLYRLTPEKYLHPGSDELVVRYVRERQVLFYFYLLDRRHPDEMEQVPSFQALQSVSNYKDIDGTDYVVLSGSATNFSADSVWRSYAVSRAGWRQRPSDEPIPDTVEAELQALAQTWYFGPVDVHLGLEEPAEGEVPWAYPIDYLDPCLLRYVTEPALNLD